MKGNPRPNKLPKSNIFNSKWAPKGHWHEENPRERFLNDHAKKKKKNPR